MYIRLSCLLVAGALSVCAAGASSTFVLLDGRTGEVSTENQERARLRLSPCSTFKIPNTLIALETGVVPDAKFTLQYEPARDGEQTGSWSRDHSLKTALSDSVVWYYRELARRIGPERMRKYVDQFEYGNRDLSGGIDRFWLDSSLRISAEEQVRFLRKFHENRLGVSPRVSSIVHDMLLLEVSPDYRLYGKTGLCGDPEHGPVAWQVGFVERGGRTFYYALNIGGESFSEIRRLRASLLREKLAAAGLVAPTPPTSRQQMETKVKSAIEAVPGVVSLYAKNLDTGAAFGIRENERVRTASTIKLPIMAAVFAAVEQGKARWEDSIEMRAEDKVSGSGVIREFADGTKLSLRDLVHMMIVVSDNTATNLVLDHISADYVNAEMNKLGLNKTRSLRKVMNVVASGHSREGLQEDFKRFGLGVSTPAEMVSLLERIERRAVVSPAASAEMLAILGRQQYKDGIGRQFPYERVASKSGSLDRLRSDVGLVYSTGGRIAIAVTIDDMLRTDYSADNAGSLLISELGQLLVAGLSAPVSDLAAPEKTIELQSEMDHVQGIEVDGDRLWVTWVDRKKKTGHLGEFDLFSGRLIRSTTLHNGDRYHPGGIAADGDSLWMPVAEYKANSSATIQRRSKRTLELVSEFPVNDHIGCVAALNGRLYGANWDSRQIYVWDLSGKLIDKRENPSGTAFQDMKFADGLLVGSGLRSDGGAIDWLDPKDLRLVRRVRAGKSSRGVLLTHEGMAIANDRLYLLPEDSPSRLFVFPLPR